MAFAVPIEESNNANSPVERDPNSQRSRPLIKAIVATNSRTQTIKVNLIASSTLLLCLILARVFSHAGTGILRNENIYFVLGLAELGLAVFFLSSVGAILATSAFDRFRKYQFGYEVNFLFATLVTVGAVVSTAFSDLSIVANQSILNSFACFALFSSLVLFSRRKLENFLTKIGQASLKKLVPSSRLVRPQSQFSQDSLAGQGELFPPELAMDVPALSLRPGDIIRVKEGESIPCDGVVVEGTAILRERRQSGYGLKRSKERGDEIFAGSLLLVGSIDVKIGLTQDESLAATHDDEFSNSPASEYEMSITDHLLSLAHLSFFFFGMLAGAIVVYQSMSLLEVSRIVSSVLLLSLFVGVVGLNSLVAIAIRAQAFLKGIYIRSTELFRHLVNIKTAIFVVDPTELFVSYEANALQIMDARIDKSELGTVILGLCLRAEHPIMRSVVNHMIRKEKVAPKIFDIEGFKEYPGRGLTGSVSKADFTIGFEDFLIDRGVFLQSTDALPAAAGMTIFIAVGSDVIARIPLEDAGLTFKQRCIQPLMSLGIRSVLVSSSSQEKIDSLGKRLGFELSNLFGGLDTQSLNSKIDSMDPGIVFLPENQNLIVNGDRHITATVFDELRESTLPAELVLFNKSPRSVSVIGDLSREMRWLALEKKMLLSLAAIAVVGSFIAGFLSPIVPLAMTLLSILYISLMPGRALKSISSLNE